MTSATVVLDHKFRIDSHGRLCATTMFGNSFWSRYLQTFDEVQVVCRAKPMTDGENVSPINLPRLTFHPVPYYDGPQEYFCRRAAIKRSVNEALRKNRAIILRAPQILPVLAYHSIRSQRRSFGVEVVGDPWDVYGPGAERHPLRPFFRWYFSRKLRELCRNASALSYVTKGALQRRYPPSEYAFSTYASSVEIFDIAHRPRPAKFFETRPFRLLFVGALNRLYKGQDILIRAFANLLRSGLDVHLTIVGDGQYKSNLMDLAQKFAAHNRIDFMGEVQFGTPVLEQMDRAQLFVLPSRQEGLARTAVEALSRGLPCVCTDVGGMSEIVPTNCLVEAGSVDALTERLVQVIQQPRQLAELSSKGLEVAREFLHESIEPRRQAFFRSVLNSYKSH